MLINKMGEVVMDSKEQFMLESYEAAIHCFRKKTKKRGVTVAYKSGELICAYRRYGITIDFGKENNLITRYIFDFGAHKVDEKERNLKNLYFALRYVMVD